MIIGFNPASTINANWRLWDCGVTWAHLEPTKNNFKWDLLDHYVSTAEGRIMLVLGHPPEWATTGGNGRQAHWLPPGSNMPPLGRQRWQRYVRAVVSRYKGRIKYYQVWNEPADHMFYSGTFEVLAALTAEARQIISRVDSTAKVVSAPLQPRPASGWPKRGHFIVNAYERHRFPFDIWSMHIYPETPKGPIRFESMLKDGKREIGASKKPLFITETNYNAPAGPALASNVAVEYRNRTIKICKKHGVDGLWFYAVPGQFGLQPADLA